MKTIILLLIALLTESISNAQITLSHNDNPVTIDTVGLACL